MQVYTCAQASQLFTHATTKPSPTQVSELDYKARIKTIMVDQQSTEGKPPYRRRTSQVSAKTMQKKNSQARLLEGREYPSTNGRAGTDNSVSQPGHSQS
ncbi:hypothetical protein SARC_15821, partial [Sphaeroforma arctica JP610]